MKKKLFFLFPFLISCSLSAQFYTPDGGHDPSIKWQQIDTDHVKVIFPSSLTTKGQRIANVITHLYEKNTGSIGVDLKKASILLHSETVNPNGFVFIAPFGSEFFATPPQRSFLGTVDWIDGLAIHEYRHIMQTQNMHKGLTKFVSTLSGESAWWGFSHFAVPDWFFEGDAVLQETALTNSGRGRLPEFLAYYRAFAKDKKRYSFNKVRNGSMKDVIPDHYALGYVLNTYARIHFGNNIWKEVIEDAASYKLKTYPIPFSNALKERTSLNTKNLYENSFNELDSLWFIDNEKRKNQIVNQKNKAARKNTPQFYKQAFFNKDNELIVAKRSNAHPSKLVLLDQNQEEKRLFTFPNSINQYFSYRNDFVVYEEFQWHPRWENTSYSTIHLRNIKTGFHQQLTRKSKYFSPDISNDLKQIAVVQILPSMEQSIHILTSKDGTVAQKLDNPNGYSYAFPKWSKDDTKLYVIVYKDQKNAIIEIDIESGKEQIILEFNDYRIVDLQVQEDYVYFASNFNQTIQDIFALHIPSKAIYQLSHSPTNAAYPAINADGEKLVYAEHHSDGTNLVEQIINWDVLSPIQMTPQKSIPNLVQPIAKAEAAAHLDHVPNRTYEVSKYKEFKHLFYVHDWIPKPFHPNYSLQIESRNRLQTLGTFVESGININENNFFLNSGIEITKWFPKIKLNYATSLNRSAQFVATTDTSAAYTSRTWDENRFSGGINLPLNLTKGSFFQLMSLEAQYQLTNVQHDSLSYESLNGNQHLMNLGFNFRSQHFRAIQQVNTRFGITLSTNYRFNLNNTENNQWNILGRLHLPGILNTHAIWVEGNYRTQAINDSYRFVDDFQYARGYGQFQGDEQWGFRTTYQLPLFYPDWGLGPIAFIQRFRLGVFADFSGVQILRELDGTRFNYASYGIELSADVKWFRMFDLPVGIRVNYRRDYELFGLGKPFSFGLILN